MALADIAKAIEDQIRTDMDPEPPPKVLFGVAKLFKENRPPRIVFVPKTERITGPSGQGGDGIGAPRPLFTRNVVMEAHIWGKDGPDTERFLDILVRALHGIGWGSYTLTEGSWIAAGEAETDKGEVYVLTMEWRVPITRAPDTYAVVSQMPLDPLTVVT